jgi:hypothetical protein
LGADGAVQTTSCSFFQRNPIGITRGRPSRQLAKAGLVLGYLGLTIAGTIALAAGAMRLGLAVG